MADSVIATNYAEALFNIALKHNLLKEYKEQLFKIGFLYENNSDLKNIINHPKINKDDKKNIIVKLFNDIDKNIISFLKLLIDNNRFYEIKNISEHLTLLVNKKLEIKVAKVVSAIKLDENYKKSIEDMIKKKTDKELEFTFEIDEKLIAGIKVILDDEIMDNTLYKNFNNLKNSLVER